MKYFLIILTLVVFGFFLIKFPQNTAKFQPPNLTKVTDSSVQFSKKVYVESLGNPRVLVFSPGGTLLVSIPSQDKVLALPSKKVIISGEDHVHGLAFYQGKLFIADVNKVVRYNWDESKLEATKDKVLFSLPENNNHNNRTITFDEKGNMYISLGSTCNVCNQDSNIGGSVLISNAGGEAPKVYAEGLRNAAFIKINPKTGELWGSEMGRDLLGDDLPPDEFNIIKAGKNYGWPNCYGDKIPDTDFNPQSSSSSCSSTEAPIFKIPAHNAPLGWVFIDSPKFPKDWQGDILLALHGSWNRTVPDGYKLVHLKVSGNTITGSEDFLTGFIENGVVNSRPVDLAFDKEGNLYLSDDKEGKIFIIAP